MFQPRLNKIPKHLSIANSLLESCYTVITTFFSIPCFNLTVFLKCNISIKDYKIGSKSLALSNLPYSDFQR